MKLSVYEPLMNPSHVLDEKWFPTLGKKYVFLMENAYYATKQERHAIPEFIKKAVSWISKRKVSELEKVTDQVYRLKTTLYDREHEVLSGIDSIKLYLRFSMVPVDEIEDPDFSYEFQNIRACIDYDEGDVILVNIVYHLLTDAQYRSGLECAIDHELRHVNDLHREGPTMMKRKASAKAKQEDLFSKINAKCLEQINIRYYGDLIEEKRQGVVRFMHTFFRFLTDDEIDAYMHSFRGLVLTKSNVNLKARTFDGVFKNVGREYDQVREYLRWYNDPSLFYEFVTSDIPFLDLLSITTNIMCLYENPQAESLLVKQANDLYETIGGNPEKGVFPDFKAIQFVNSMTFVSRETQIKKCCNEISLTCERILCTIFRKHVLPKIEHMIGDVWKVIAQEIEDPDLIKQSDVTKASERSENAISESWNLSSRRKQGIMFIG